MIVTRTIIAVLVVAGLLLVGCAGDQTTEAEATATQRADDEEVRPEATTAIEELGDELQEEDNVDATRVVTTTAIVTGTTTVAATEEGADADAASNTVHVELAEYEIRMPTSVPAGLTRFEVTNVGTGEHSFEIEGEDLQVGFESHVQVGETKQMEVNLLPGTYEIYCPVGEHRERGMEVTLTVTDES